MKFTMRYYPTVESGMVTEQTEIQFRDVTHPKTGKSPKNITEAKQFIKEWKAIKPWFNFELSTVVWNPVPNNKKIQATFDLESVAVVVTEHDRDFYDDRYDDWEYYDSKDLDII